MPALKPHKFTQNGKTYFVNLPDVYNNGGGYTIGSAFGISKLTATDDVEGDTSEVSNLLKNGIVVRVRISYKVGTKNKTAKVICPISKASSGITSVRTKQYNSAEVRTSGIPRRRRLG